VQRRRGRFHRNDGPAADDADDGSDDRGQFDADASRCAHFDAGVWGEHSSHDRAYRVERVRRLVDLRLR